MTMNFSYFGAIARWKLHCYAVPFGHGNSIRCADSPANGRGFGSKSRNKKPKVVAPAESPGLSPEADRKIKYTSPDDFDFEQRLKAVRKSALEQRKIEEGKAFAAIDYDAPAETSGDTFSLSAKIGVGVSIIALALVFALGDLFPYGSFSSTEEASSAKNISDEERANLEKKLKQFQEALDVSPEDSAALEGASRTLLEMGEYKRALTLLEEIVEKRPITVDAYRLLGDVKYELKDYEGSLLAYRSAERASKSVDYRILKGLTNALLATNRPEEAVQLLLASRERRLNNENNADETSRSIVVASRPNIDLIQVDLLLGKAYSKWGHISDAISVYDHLISAYPDDFRGYLAKGILLKENGNRGDAERMFIQARFFAPDKSTKALVNKYSSSR